MKKIFPLLILFAFIGMAGSFTSCKKKEILTDEYFIGPWNLVKMEHRYMYDSGDKLVSDIVTRDLVYDFAKDSVTIRCDGQFIYKTSWFYKNGVLDMPVLHDHTVHYHYSPVWYIEEVSTDAFAASSRGGVTAYDSIGNKIEYTDVYTYSLERKK